MNESTKPSRATRTYAVMCARDKRNTARATPSPMWTAALRACGVDVVASTTFAAGTAVYIAQRRVKVGAYVDFAYKLNDGSAARFTARIDAIQQIDGAILLLQTSMMRATDEHDVLVDSGMSFVFCAGTPRQRCGVR